MRFAPSSDPYKRIQSQAVVAGQEDDTVIHIQEVGRQNYKAAVTILKQHRLFMSKEEARKLAKDLLIATED